MSGVQAEYINVFVASSAYLFLKMFANSGVQGYARFRWKSFKYREDQGFFGAPFDENRPQPELLMRADAAWRNDLENIPMFVVAALCGALSGVPLPLYRVLVLAFCAARTLHTPCLLFGWQPWRFLSFALGIASTLLLYGVSLRQLGW
jgi:glutathione S-transferase